MTPSKNKRKQQVKKALEKTPNPQYVDHYIAIANLKYYLELEKHYLGDSCQINP